MRVRCGVTSRFSFWRPCLNACGCCVVSSGDSESCLFLPISTTTRTRIVPKMDLKTTCGQSNGHHATTLSLPLPHSLSFSLWLSHSFSGVKENEVIVFINNYQRQTPCKQKGQARAANRHPVCPACKRQCQAIIVRVQCVISHHSALQMCFSDSIPLTDPKTHTHKRQIYMNLRRNETLHLQQSYIFSKKDFDTEH